MPASSELIASVLCPRYPLGIDGIDFGDGSVRPLPGGFCVFRVDLPASLAQIAEVRASRGVDAMPYICSDLERGAGQQISGLTRLPPALAIGAAGSVSLARAAGALTAREALVAGVAVLFAPVLDVGDEPQNPIVASRAFGADPALVGRMGIAWIEGCLAAGAVPCAKHFPGHGATLADSHDELPLARSDLAEYEAIDERPFCAAIEHGLPAVMAGHVHSPPLDGEPALPASLSRRAISGRLRGHLGFSGTVFTDALDMGAIDAGKTLDGPAADPAVRALLAGCDVPLLCADPHRSARAIRAALESGLLAEERLREAATRIRHLVQGVDVARRPTLAPDPEGRALALEIARRSVVSLPETGGAVLAPLSGRDVDLVIVNDAQDGDTAADRLLLALGDAGVRARRSPAADLCPAASLVVAVFSDVRAEKGRVLLAREQSGRLRDLLTRDGGVLLSIGPPQAVSEFLGKTPTVFVFDDDPASLAAAAEVLAGERQAQGLPCWLPASRPEPGETE